MKKKEIADLIGITESGVKKWAEIGFPIKPDYTPEEVILFLYANWKNKYNPEAEETKKLIELEDLRKKRFANDLAEGQYLDKAETEQLISAKLSILSDALLSIPPRISHKYRLEPFVEKSLHSEIFGLLENLASSLSEPTDSEDLEEGLADAS